ncbi:uracil-DNA glycosylase family protein [Lysobacter gummosus]|uniref:hypothetical protein n=1 Tax=Lysobacter gummosus TaxID=262324 RepID=UPI00363821BA
MALRAKVRSAPRAPASAVPFAKPVEGEIPRAGLRQLRAMAADCRACPLWRDATQTVFGEGPRAAASSWWASNPATKRIAAAGLSSAPPAVCSTRP